MNKNIENKLLHFYTSGNIYEDFAAARTLKTARLRRIIRICFYAHCVVAALCIILAAALGAGLGTIPVAVCEIILAGLAFLAVGDMSPMKTILYCGDIVFAAAMFVTGALSSVKPPYFTVGAISIVTALIALLSYFAADCKTYLENFSPLTIKREHYTLIPNTSPEPAEEKPKEEPQILIPPQKTEMRELADKLQDIFKSETTKTNEITENNPENGTQSQVPETEVLQ